MVVNGEWVYLSRNVSDSSISIYRVKISDGSLQSLPALNGGGFPNLTGFFLERPNGSLLFVESGTLEPDNYLTIHSLK